MKNLYFDQICDIVPSGAKVLDLGCGNGDLLGMLRTQKQVQGYGIEIDFDRILSCTKRNIPVFHGDIDEGLPEFTSHSYDYVILSSTLQQVRRPVFVLNEMLRVGKRVIVTFPNFGYWRIRLQLLIKGVSPKTTAIPYDWFDTPNIRVITINSFRDLCRKEHIRIAAESPLFHSSALRCIFPRIRSNLFSQQGLFVLEKAGGVIQGIST